MSEDSWVDWDLLNFPGMLMEMVSISSESFSRLLSQEVKEGARLFFFYAGPPLWQCDSNISSSVATVYQSYSMMIVLQRLNSNRNARIERWVAQKLLRNQAQEIYQRHTVILLRTVAKLCSETGISQIQVVWSRRHHFFNRVFSGLCSISDAGISRCHALFGCQLNSKRESKPSHSNNSMNDHSFEKNCISKYTFSRI